MPSEPEEHRMEMHIETNSQFATKMEYECSSMTEGSLKKLYGENYKDKMN